MNKTLVIVMCLAACTPSQPPVVAQTADPEVPEPPVVATPQRAEPAGRFRRLLEPPAKARHGDRREGGREAAQVGDPVVDQRPQPRA